MTKKTKGQSLSRRKFLATGSLIAAAPGVVSGALNARGTLPSAPPVIPTPPSSMRKIPIGVFDPVYQDLSLEAMLDKITALGLEANGMEKDTYEPQSQLHLLCRLLAEKTEEHTSELQSRLHLVCRLLLV